MSTPYQLKAKGILELLGGGRRHADRTTGHLQTRSRYHKLHRTVHFPTPLTAPSTERYCTIHGGFAPSGACTEAEQKEGTEPPAGESRARPREGEIFSNDGGDEEVADRRQPSLFLPINGGGDRKARLAVINSYNPSPALIERAAELGVDAHAEDVFGKWRRHRIANNRLPLDFEAAEADFENWIRDESRHRDAEREHLRGSGYRNKPGAMIATALKEARIAMAAEIVPLHKPEDAEL
jgi:hypothetical protein